MNNTPTSHEVVSLAAPSINQTFNKSDKDKYHMISLTVESKIQRKRTYLQKRNRLTDRDQTCGCQGGGKEGEGWTENLGLIYTNYYI